MTFRGSYTVTVTPFTEDGSAIDLDAHRRFIDWQLGAGVPGLIILGSTGEFLTISDAERTALVEATVEHVAGRVPVLVGTMNAYTVNAVRYSREAETLGADGLMIVPPYYYTPTENEIFDYYRAISEAVSIPIMLYNNPVTSNVDISAALVARLTSSLENVRYIKEASLDVARVYDVVETTGGVMQVFAGERIVESFLLGAIGYVNPFGNFVPGASSLIWDLLTAGQLEEAKQIERKLDELNAIIAAGHPTYGHQCYSKALAAVAGYPVGDVRPPLTTFRSLGAEGDERVRRITPLMQELDEMAERFAPDPRSPRERSGDRGHGNHTAMTDLTGKTALVTGASKGIGAEIAAALGRAGGLVIAAYNSDHEGARSATAAIPEERKHLLSLDLGQPGAGRDLWQQAQAWRGSIDVLVCNAAVMLDSPLGASDAEWDEAWRRTLAVNVVEPANLMRCAARDFVAQGGGTLIVLSSWSAQRGSGNPDLLAYGASKAALKSLAQTLARAHAKHGLLVYVIAPGIVRTQMSEISAARLGGEEAVTATLAMGEWVPPQEIGELVTFLASGSMRHLSGATLDVNGATYIR